MRMTNRCHAPPAWLVEGALVDYCPILGEPPKHFGMVVRTGPYQLESGRWVVWLEGKPGCVAVEACHEAAGQLRAENA